MMEHEYIERVEKLREKGYNCAQSVACTFVDLLPIDEPTLFKISEGFGGGIGGHDGICGALSGAVMVASLLSSSGSSDEITKEKTYQLSKQLYDSFVSIAGSPICTELKGESTGEPLFPCEMCIREAVRLTWSVIEPLVK